MMATARPVDLSATSAAPWVGVAPLLASAIALSISASSATERPNHPTSKTANWQGHVTKSPQRAEPLITTPRDRVSHLDLIARLKSAFTDLPDAPSPDLVEHDQQRRPGPLRWVWYTFGGGLGPRYRQWVLHDLTGPTRWLRQMARAVVQVVPLAAVVLLVLGFGWIAWVGVGCGLVLALIYSSAYFDPAADHRLVKHGYPSGTAQRILSERDKAKHPDRMRRYMQTYRNNAT